MKSHVKGNGTKTPGEEFHPDKPIWLIVKGKI
jgi:hypothetical protein